MSVLRASLRTSAELPSDYDATVRQEGDQSVISSDTREERVSATEASRSFSRILDRVESSRGRFLVHRRGREVCVIAPPTCTDGVIHRFGREVGAVYCQASDLTLHSVIRRGVPG